MKNRRKDNKPTEDLEDVTSWDLPSQIDADGVAPTETSKFFEPPAGLQPVAPTTSTPVVPPPLPPLDTELPSLPPPPPPPEAPMDSWTEAAPSAEVRDFPAGASTASSFRPDLPIPGAVIDLTSRTEHPYDDIYSLGDRAVDTSSIDTSSIDTNNIDTADRTDLAPTASEATDSAASNGGATETIDLAERLDLTTSATPSGPDGDGAARTTDSFRELPEDLRSALQIATTPALGLPQIDGNPELEAATHSPGAAVSSLPAPPTAQASATAQTPSILTVDVLGEEPPNLLGLFTDVLTDNGFDVNSVSETSILLTRETGTATIDRAEVADGCIVEVAGLPATAVKKLMLAGLLQIGYEIQASRATETVLRNQDKSLARIVHVSPS